MFKNTKWTTTSIKKYTNKPYIYWKIKNKKIKIKEKQNNNTIYIFK